MPVYHIGLVSFGPTFTLIFVAVFWFGGQTWLCSGLTPASALRDHSWWYLWYRIRCWASNPGQLHVGKGITIAAVLSPWPCLLFLIWVFSIFETLVKYPQALSVRDVHESGGLIFSICFFLYFCKARFWAHLKPT